MRLGLFLATAPFWILPLAARGQFQDDAPATTNLGEVVVQRWRVGMVVTAQGSGFRKIVGTIAVPTDWPEQRVRVIENELSRDVSIDFQTVENTARQMVVKIPALAEGQEAKAIVVLEIQRTLPLPPDETDSLVLPNPKKLDRRMAVHLGPSPYIESTHPEIKKAAATAGAGKQGAWEKVEAIYDWMRQKVQYKDEPLKGALAALRDGTGDCDELSSLFIALCRANDIPARTVRVPGHCYPEFYLLDAQGKGRWYPCQAAGTRAFGGMPDPRPILQKGDNVPGIDPSTKKRVRYRFLPENLIGLPAGPGGNLKLQLVCEPVKQNVQ